jgi:CHAT domain-containing protein
MNDVDGWAPALLESGASGYIGALWPVSDEVAELFAATFYGGVGEMLEANKQLSVADLLMLTRRDVFRKTHDATALAYVFYGDPKLVLRKPRDGN